MLEDAISTAKADGQTRADIIRVASTSGTTAVAGAIAGVMRIYKFAEVQAMGAGAVNQAVKAIAIARKYLQGDNIDIICTIKFIDIDIDGEKRTALYFAVGPRP